MLSLRKPSADALRRFLAGQRELPFIPDPAERGWRGKRPGDGPDGEKC